jgi:predicted amidohydrolase
MSFSTLLVQNAPFLSKKKNIKQTKDIISQNQDIDLIIFPELCLSGYMLQDGVYDEYFTKEELQDIFCDIKNDIIISCALLDNNSIYNSAIYLSKGKIIHIHHKNFLPNYALFQEDRFFSKDTEIQSFVIDNNKIAMIICEDLWQSSSINKLKQLDVDIVIILSASPSRDFEDNLHIQEQWDSLLKATAILSSSFCIFVNRVGFEDGLGFWGGSKVITPDAKVAKVAKLFKEDKIYIDIDTKAYLYNKQQRR